MTATLHWQSPSSKPAVGRLVHLLSAQSLHDGTKLTVCSARITQAWLPTHATVTCTWCSHIHPAGA